MVTERKAKQEGDKAVARKAGKCECLDPTCARTILAGETYFIGPQKDYSHGPYAYNRINRHCPTAVKYIMAKQSMEVTMKTMKKVDKKLQRDPAGRYCPDCAVELQETIPLDSNGTCHGCGSCFGKKSVGT